MTVTLSFAHLLYLVVVILLIAPYVYDTNRGHHGTYDFHIDSVIVFVGCWAFAIALIIGKFIGGLLK